ncbi:hypothetical protein ACF0H5_019066 [Mactra antiquata]
MTNYYSSCVVSCFIVTIVVFMLITSTTGSLSGRETLRNLTTCSTDNIVIDCGSDKIAIEKVELLYKAGACDGVYDAVNDCMIDPTDGDRRATLRECSGKTSCMLNLQVTREFCTSGINQVTYIHVQYYCISSSNIVALDCSTTSRTSTTGAPLYLTNPNYPSKTPGSVSCNCSVEVQDCSSQLYQYTLDQDLYDDGSSCQQTVTFDADGSTIKTLACESFYSSFALTESLSDNFVTVTYGSSSNIDGYFFIGLAATVSSATMTLTCQAQTETWCIDCGSLPSLSNGNYAPTGGSSYGSTANVNCNTGYDRNTTVISCMEEGVWGAGSCTIKDCGTPSSINNGTIQLISSGVTTYGALASVVCDSGFTASANQISCLSTGSWQSVSCQSEDNQDNTGTVKNGGGAGFPEWGYALIVIFVLLLVVGIVVIYLCCRGNRGIAPLREAENSKKNNAPTDVEKGPESNGLTRNKLSPLDVYKPGAITGQPPLPPILSQKT